MSGLYQVIYDLAILLLPSWLSHVIAGLLIMFILVNAVLLGAAVFVWMERRLIGRFHNRVGPNRWGPFGLFQPFADVLKLVFKEDLTPANADRPVFLLVPIAMIMPVILMMAVVPFAQNTALVNLNVGVLYVVAVTSVTALAIFMAGWASNNRFAMFGAARGVAVLISYEVPVVMALLGVVIVAGSMSMADVVSAQTVPFILVQPLAFFVFLAGTSAELNRTPFDVAEAESELVGGLPHRIQRREVRLDPSGGIRRRAHRFGGDGYPVPKRLVRPSFGVPRLAVVLAEGGCPCICFHLDPVDLSSIENRPDHGFGLEVPATPEYDQPTSNVTGGLLLPRRRRGSEHAGSLDNGRYQRGGGRGFHRVIWNHGPRKGQAHALATGCVPIQQLLHRRGELKCTAWEWPRDSWSPLRT